MNDELPERQSKERNEASWRTAYESLSSKLTMLEAEFRLSQIATMSRREPRSVTGISAAKLGDTGSGGAMPQANANGDVMFAQLSPVTGTYFWRTTNSDVADGKFLKYVGDGEEPPVVWDGVMEMIEATNSLQIIYSNASNDWVLLDAPNTGGVYFLTVNTTNGGMYWTYTQQVELTYCNSAGGLETGLFWRNA